VDGLIPLIIERAVYKASPLTIGPDEEIFDRQVQFRFSAN